MSDFLENLPPQRNDQVFISPLLNSMNTDKDLQHAPIGQQLKHQAEQLYAFVIYAAINPKEYEESLRYLSVIQCLGEAGFLSDEEERYAVDYLLNLKEQLHGGEIAIHDTHFTEALQFLLQHIEEANLRTHVVALLTQLEYQMVIQVKDESQALKPEEFKNIADPFLEKLKEQDLRDFEITPIVKALKEVHEGLQREPHNIAHYKQQLIEQGQSFKKAA